MAKFRMKPHTAAKHTILRQYLGAWLPIIASNERRILVVDGFAGPGVYEGGEDGSPIIILKTILDHQNFQSRKTQVICLFVELDDAVSTVLRAQVEELQAQRPFPEWLTIHLEEGNAFDRVMSGILDQVSTGKRLIPTFAFIDPFGIKGVPMDVVSRLLQHPKSEVLITWMFESMERWAKTPEFQPHMDAMFGGNDWAPLVKRFKGDELLSALSDLYESALKEEASVEYIRSFEMRNKSNRTEYLLVFATDNEVGLSKMKAAMWKVDPLGGSHFYDRTNPDQPMLLGAEEQIAPQLRRMLIEEFRGQGPVPIKRLASFVVSGTPFLETHLKRMTLGPMEREDPPVIRVQRPEGKRKRPGEYPPGTTIEFISSKDFG
jgi:three-Cys-motif partner protein